MASGRCMLRSDISKTRSGSSLICEVCKRDVKTSNLKFVSTIIEQPVIYLLHAVLMNRRITSNFLTLQRDD